MNNALGTARNYLVFKSGFSLGLIPAIVVFAMTIVSALGTTAIADYIYKGKTAGKHQLQPATWVVTMIYRVAINGLFMALPKEYHLNFLTYNHH